MTYNLEFDPRALKEWKKIDTSIRKQFKKKLVQILQEPKIEANRLRQLPCCYKIKLAQVGYRLVYQVREEAVVVFVIAVGKRDRLAVYNKAEQRAQ